MDGKRALAGLLSLVVLGSLAGCGGAAGTTTPEQAETVPVVEQTAPDRVVAEAVIEPARWSHLFFDVAGRVEEVLVAPGDAVNEGEPLVRLETTGLERAVSRAELNLRQAQLALERLKQPADEAEIRQAQNDVAEAASALEVAQLNLTTVLSSTLLNETLEDARSAFEEAQNLYTSRLEQYERGEIDYWLVDQARQSYEDARRELFRIQQQGDLELENARNQVDQARRTYQEARDNLERLLEGADPLDLEEAQLNVEAAQIALEEARENLEKATLRAPFDGMVATVNVQPGDSVAPGDVVVVVATLDRLQARTIDLTELDVVRIGVDQPATVTVDALPDVQLSGRVRQIGLEAVEYRGDVTYPVIIELDEGSYPGLRWGMTAMVEIETP